jgi:hypothetical protein
MSDSPAGGASDVRGADAQGVLPTRWVRSSRAHRASAMWRRAILHPMAPCGKSRPEPVTAICARYRTFERGCDPSSSPQHDEFDSAQTDKPPKPPK